MGNCWTCEETLRSTVISFFAVILDQSFKNGWPTGQRQTCCSGAVTSQRQEECPLFEKVSWHGANTARNGDEMTFSMTRIDPYTFGPWAIVTGASSGIGKEFARQLAAERIPDLVCGGAPPAPSLKS